SMASDPAVHIGVAHIEKGAAEGAALEWLQQIESAQQIDLQCLSRVTEGLRYERLAGQMDDCCRAAVGKPIIEGNRVQQIMRRVGYDAPSSCGQSRYMTADKAVLASDQEITHSTFPYGAVVAMVLPGQNLAGARSSSVQMARVVTFRRLVFMLRLLD